MKLDDEQRKRLDDAVYAAIASGTTTNRVATIAPKVAEMLDGIRLPFPTGDRGQGTLVRAAHRLVDHAIQRLRKTGRIEQIKGHYGWIPKRPKRRGKK